ncbi:MAG: hypothetical protein R3A45_04780 [Bdellovibrionota bacterium]
MAHALKTPLAALGAMLDEHQQIKDFTQLSKQQLHRMQHLIDYQLKKASTVGHSPFTKPIAIDGFVAAIVSSLEKVYRHKNITFTTTIPPDKKVKMEEGDLLEVLGNVIENAAKYGTSKVRITWEAGACIIEDDGPGLSKKDMQRIIKEVCVWISARKVLALACLWFSKL